MNMNITRTIRLTIAIMIAVIGVSFAANPNETQANEYRFFSVDEANELLPEIEKCVSEIKILKDNAAQNAQRENALSKGSGKADLHVDITPVDPDNLKKSMKYISDSIERFKDAGVIIRHMEVGLVDFPHMREGRVVFLCWQSGEKKLRFWHEVNGGKDGRKPLYF